MKERVSLFEVLQTAKAARVREKHRRHSGDIPETMEVHDEGSHSSFFYDGAVSS